MISGMLNIRFSPESLCMLSLAIMVDLGGIVLLCIGLDDFGLLDIVGIFFINGWLLMRGDKSMSHGKRGYIKQFKSIFTNKYLKFALPTFIEIIPYLGWLPMWTISVLCNLDQE